MSSTTTPQPMPVPSVNITAMLRRGESAADPELAIGGCIGIILEADRQARVRRPGDRESESWSSPPGLLEGGSKSMPAGISMVPGEPQNNPGDLVGADAGFFEDEASTAAPMRHHTILGAVLGTLYQCSATTGGGRDRRQHQLDARPAEIDPTKNGGLSLIDRDELVLGHWEEPEGQARPVERGDQWWARQREVPSHRGRAGSKYRFCTSMWQSELVAAGVRAANA